jgi:hypothetical protein
MFNKGYLCINHGPVQESVKRSINKVKHDCCKICGAVVRPWERPLNERAGRCNNCAGGCFGQKLVNRHLIRVCNICTEEYNTDTNKIIKPGRIELKYGK